MRTPVTLPVPPVSVMVAALPWELLLSVSSTVRARLIA